MRLSTRLGIRTKSNRVSATGRHRAMRKRRLLVEQLEQRTLLSATGLVDNPSDADYLIITANAFYDQVLPLALWKQMKGFKTYLAKMDEVLDPINPDPPADVAAYIKQEYVPLAPDPTAHPSYVLLVGDVPDLESPVLDPPVDPNDATFDPSIHVPSDFTHENLGYERPHEYPAVYNYVSDHGYACLDGPDDLLPNLTIGRLPVNTVERAAMAVDKILRYDRTPDLGDWYDDALVAASFEDIFSPSEDNEAREYYLETAIFVRDKLEELYVVDPTEDVKTFLVGPPKPVWDTPQAVIVTGVDDAEADGDVGYWIHTDVSNGDPNYVSLTVPDVSVVNMDNETAGITVSALFDLFTSEAGETAAFTVVLNKQPTANVTVDLSSSDTSEGTLSTGQLTFTSGAMGNWDSPQTVTVTGVDDAPAVDDGDQPYTIEIWPAVSADSAYHGLDPADVSVTNRDNDPAGITVWRTSDLVTSEAGGTDRFAMVLDNPPTADVTVALSSSNSAHGAVYPASFTFTPENWYLAQEALVTGLDGRCGGQRRGLHGLHNRYLARHQQRSQL